MASVMNQPSLRSIQTVGKSLTGLLLLALCSSLVWAEKRAPVDELGVNVAQVENSAQPANQQQIDSYYQMQVLQEEVRQLRGLVEELGYELKQLKQRQMDDYLDLDRRLSASITGASATAPAVNNGTSSATPNGAAATTNPAPVGDAEKASYSNAYQLLRNKQFEESGKAFQKYIDSYPNGKYVSNAYYWQGEIALLGSELEKARQAFAMVVNNYPTTRKSPDAAFKLGTVYHQLGDNAKAKELLTKVAAGNSRAARLAKQYLADNF